MKLAQELQDWISEPSSAGGCASRHVLLALDFDGTLAELNPVPGAVQLPERAGEAILALSTRLDCAIVSGRSLADLRSRVCLAGVHFIGNHGCEIQRRDGANWHWWSDDWERWRAERLGGMSELAQNKGGYVEDKHYSLAVHFRPAAEQDWWENEARLVLETLAGRAATLMGGNKCWNIIPVGAPNKGDGIVRLCQDTGHDSVVYIGDEETDENVFRLQAIPVFGIKVGAGETAARARLADPAEVIRFLRSWAGLP